ncbi:hypothetical protein DPMN_074589 [Dreissena polymorpha]|uniref:Uncharacterized protein n=1 Tax=Dreissena polymorpha TaxID=45954 RepID=A0A9D4BE68_DREPO|nr:hypothetical protein DPMN_074589 [Dreissena polymorpha]
MMSGKAVSRAVRGHLLSMQHCVPWLPLKFTELHRNKRLHVNALTLTRLIRYKLLIHKTNRRQTFRLKQTSIVFKRTSLT